MELTEEQHQIINSTGNIKINAVAGSGKTTTIIEYAKKRQSNSKILYLAFNKSVKLEAIQKFSAQGLNNVQVETAHSLAYRHIVNQNGYKIKANGYKSYEIAEILGLKASDDQLTEFVLGHHINKFVAYYCNSNKDKVKELNYLDVVQDEKAKHFVKANYSLILNQTRQFLGKMNTGEIEIIHDFYLKKFQLSKPKLYYDFILFDEGQDASGAMLDIFLNQDATKVIVGDTHQQIYGWRYAVNSLEKADYETLYLSNSFRFSQDIANLAMNILQMKSIISDYQEVEIFGKGEIKNKIKTRAVLARTNLMLLLKAIEMLIDKKEAKKVYFEGNFNSYIYATEGGSIYDVLNLKNNKHDQIRDGLIKKMKDFDTLKDFIDKTNDMEIAVMYDIVKKYGNELPNLLTKIKKMQVENDEKENAELIFSTVHRCKGMEYDEIFLANDFINEFTLQNLKLDKNDKMGLAKALEEINILYVAATRAKYIIHIPKSIIPKDFPDSPQIRIMATENNSTEPKELKLKYEKPKRKSRKKIDDYSENTHTFDDIRKEYKNAYKPWTEELDDELTEMYCKGVAIPKIAKHFQRNIGAINSRIAKLELVELYG